MSGTAPPPHPPPSSGNLARQWGLICLMLCHNLWGWDDVQPEFFFLCFVLVSFPSSLFGSLPPNMCKIVSGSNNQLGLKMHVSNELARQLTPTRSNFHIEVIIERRGGRWERVMGGREHERELLKLLITFLSLIFLATTAIKLQRVCIYGREGGRLLQRYLLSWLCYFSELEDSDSPVKNGGSENIYILVKAAYVPQSVFTVPANLHCDAIMKGHPEPF